MINKIIIGLTGPWIKLTIYLTRGEYANHCITEFYCK